MFIESYYWLFLILFVFHAKFALRLHLNENYSFFSEKHKKRIGKYKVFSIHIRLLLAVYNCFLLLPNFTWKSHLHESN